MLILSERDTELIPVYSCRIAIAQLHTAGAHIGDKTVRRSRSVTIGLECLIADMHLILVVTLILIQGEVFVDILLIRLSLVTGIVTLAAIVGIGRVALRVVDTLISVEYALALIVEVCASETVIVIAGGVVIPCLEDAVSCYHTTQSVEPLLICPEPALLIVGKAVVSHILTPSRAGCGGKGIGLCCLLRYLSPLGGGEVITSVNRHSALIEFLSVAEDILAHLTQVDIQVAAIVGGIALLTGIDEGVEHPELNIFYVGLFEVGRVQLSHHASPFRLWLAQCSVGIKVQGEVIWSALLGVIGQVEHIQLRGGTIIVRLLPVGIELLDIDLTHIVV